MAVTARFGGTGIGDAGAGGEGLSVHFKANSLLYLTDRVTRQFMGGAFQRALSKVHQEAGEVVAKGMVAELQRRVQERPGGTRPQRGTEHLEVSLLDERNILATASQLLVGRPAWLDESPARLYYRRIEEGDPNTFNSLPGTLFTTSFGPRGWFGPRQGSLQLRMIQRLGVGGVIQGVGPFPRYHYSEGGRRALDRFDFNGHYERELAAVGIKLSSVLR